MRQPQGFEDGTDQVVQLLQSLYGLKQAARCWNKLLHQRLSSISYHQTFSDVAVYVRQTADDHVIILAIHIDNILSFGNSIDGLQLARAQLHKTFEMKAEDPDWVMGFQLMEDREKHTISINHGQYIDAVLRQFNMHQCDPIDTPLDHGVVLSSDDGPSADEDKARMKNYPYRKLVGALIWLSGVSRPDIFTFVMSSLAAQLATLYITYRTTIGNQPELTSADAATLRAWAATAGKVIVRCLQGSL